MMLIAFLLHPWARMIRAMKATPRALADDLLVLATGPLHEAVFLRAYEATLAYIKALGAKVAPAKCYTFSSVATTRAKLGQHLWKGIGRVVPTKCSFRDLGGQLSFGVRLTGATVNARIETAIAYANKISRMPWSYDDKFKVVQMLVLPKAFYGAEAAPPAIAAMDKLGRAVAKAVGPYSQGSSNLIIQHTAGKSCLEPAAYLLQRRCMLLRRMLIKHPQLVDSWRMIWTAYAKAGHPGAAWSVDQIGPGALPCPPPGYSTRAAWSQQATGIQGPIGLLLQSLYEHKAIIDINFVIRTWPVRKVDLLYCPVQGLKAAIADIASDAHFEFLATNRTAMKDIVGFDQIAYAAAIKKVPAADKQLLRCAQSLGLWSAKHRLEHFEEGDGLCPHCGSDDAGEQHEVWRCEFFRDVQAAQDPELQQLNAENTPAHILLGVPSKIDASLDEFLIPLIGSPMARPPQNRANSLFFFSGRLSEEGRLVRDRAIVEGNCTLGEHVIQWATQCTGPPHQLCIDRVKEAAPDSPNAFSDGSVVGPSSSAPVGSFGVWLPGRGSQAPEEVELPFVRILEHTIGSPDGLALAGILEGSCMTSTRAELAGAIATLCLKGAWHIQADNAAFIGRAQTIVMGRMHRRKPWGLLPDGDLWAMLEAAILAKGHHAVWFSWGKGHATITAMDAGTVDLPNAIANGYADLAADEGHAIFENIGIKNYAATFAAKQKAYCRLIAAIQRRIARVQAAASKAREEAAKVEHEQVPKLIRPPDPPPQGDFYQGHRLYFQEYPIGMLGEEEKRLHIGIRLFWSALRWQPTAGTEPGTSWLELFALWQASAGEVRHSLIDRRPTFNKSFRDFKKRSKALFLHGDASTRALCRTSNSRRAPLAAYGLTSSIPMLSAKVVLMPPLAAKLHAMICSLQGGKSGPVPITHKLKVGRLKAPRFPPWLHLCTDPPLPALVSLRLQGLLEDQLHRGQGGPCVPRPTSFLLTCPRCHEVCEMAHRVLFHPGHVVQLWCGSCKRMASSRAWACNCGTCWMACATHRPLGFTCRTRLSLKKRAQPGVSDGHTRHRALCASRRVARLGPLGGGPSSSCRPGPSKPSGPAGPGPSPAPVVPGPPVLGPLTFERTHPSDHLPCLQAINPSKAIRVGAHANLLFRAGPPLGSPGAPSVSSLSLHEHQPSGAKRKAVSQLQPPAIGNDQCVRGNGLCPTSGWRIDQYCPLCHG